MHHLLYELKSLTVRHKEGSYATQANRQAMLWQMGEQLLAAGFNQLHAYELKGRHVNALLRRWRDDGLSPATQKNRMSTLRWWAAHVGKPDLLKPTNEAYGIAQRQTVARTSKARDLPAAQLARVRHRYVRMSLELQRAFGLRRTEAIKIRPHQADHGDHLVLQGSGPRGGERAAFPS
jgi:site-specific recombinase XerC